MNCPRCNAEPVSEGWLTWKCGDYRYRAPDKDRPPACIIIEGLNSRVLQLEHQLVQATCEHDNHEGTCINCGTEM